MEMMSTAQVLKLMFLFCALEYHWQGDSQHEEKKGGRASKFIDSTTTPKIAIIQNSTV